MTAKTSFSDRQPPATVLLSNRTSTDAMVSSAHDERVRPPCPTWATAAIAAAHSRWPADWLTDELFIEHLRGRIAPDCDPAAAVSRLAVADLYLACACARGVSAAVAAFARTILREVDAHVAGLDGSAAFADEVRQ